MNIVADENVDQQIVECLRADGHSVQSVAEFGPGTDDQAVLLKSYEASAILLTADKDFGELIFRQGMVHSGVLLIRLAGIPPDRKAELVCWSLAQHSKELFGKFSVLCASALRVRNM